MDDIGRDYCLRALYATDSKRQNNGNQLIGPINCEGQFDVLSFIIVKEGGKFYVRCASEAEECYGGRFVSNDIRQTLGNH